MSLTEFYVAIFNDFKTSFCDMINTIILITKYYQGGHGTGKTGNLVLTFSRQGKHREFCFNTGKIFETQGKYFSVTQGKI